MHFRLLSIDYKTEKCVYILSETTQTWTWADATVAESKLHDILLLVTG